MCVNNCKYELGYPITSKQCVRNPGNQGLVRIFWKIPKIPHLLTIFSQCEFLKFTNVCQKTQKSPLLFTIGTKLGKQKATLSRCNVLQPITKQRSIGNDRALFQKRSKLFLSYSVQTQCARRHRNSAKCKQRFDDQKA